MRPLLIFLTFVVWALWFGATIAVFVFGTYFHNTLPTPIFREAAHAMFQVFGSYELILAAIALVCSGALLVAYPSRAHVLLVGCMVLASGMVVTAALGLMPIMESLRNQDRVDTPEWRSLHGKYMIALAMQAALLLLTGAVIHWCQRSTEVSHAGAQRDGEELQTHMKTDGPR